MEELVKTPLSDADQCLTPISSEKYMAEKKNYIMSNPSYDLGDYLQKIDIKLFQIINIKFKNLFYKWEKPYQTQENCTIYLIGEYYENGGKNN